MRGNKNHLGERQFQTYSGWRRACKQIDANVVFEGDKEIAQAFHGEGLRCAIGEWDGDVGCVFDDASNELRLAVPANAQKLVDSYRGIRDQDGFETLELTVRAEQPENVADFILKELATTNDILANWRSLEK